MARNDRKNYHSNNLPLYVFYVVFALVTGIIIALSFNEKALVSFFREDGPAEWAQALCLLFSSVLLVYNFVKMGKKRNLYSCFSLILAFLCLFVFLEEISYGQRIFGLKTPYYFDRYNAHREINLHNLMVFDSASEIAILLVYVCWLLVSPLILLFKKSWRDFFDRNMLYIPPAAFSFTGLVGLILEIWLRFRFPGYRANSNEALELYLYLALFGTILVSAFNLKIRKRIKTGLTE